MAIDNSPITSFRGPHFFLSNFAPARVTVDGIVYATVEHAFQASKTHINTERAPIWRARTPDEAKRLGRAVSLRHDWESIKVYILAELLEQKFNNPVLANRLMMTFPRDLIEVNDWGDTYWGVSRTEGARLMGQNMLGQLLMARREKLANAGHVPPAHTTDPWV